MGVMKGNRPVKLNNAHMSDKQSHPARLNTAFHVGQAKVLLLLREGQRSILMRSCRYSLQMPPDKVLAVPKDTCREAFLMEVYQEGRGWQR